MPIKAFRKLQLIIAILLPLSVFSQSEELSKKDTNTYNDVKRYKGESRFGCDTNDIVEDTLFLTLFRYDPLFSGDYMYASMGNIGRPHRPLFLSTPSIQFTFRTFPIVAYEYKMGNTNIYNVKSPFTRLFYTTGSGKENYLEGVHAQTIKNISFGINFRVISALGFYLNEKSSNTGGSFYVGYDHSNKKYGNFSGFMFNRLNPQENGGIENDSIFEQNSQPNRAGVNTRLSQAQNKIKTNTLFFSQYYNPFFHQKDTSTSDINPGTFEQIFSYERNYHIFEETAPNASNYEFFIRDTANTYDSTSNIKATNGIYWSNYSMHRQPKKSSYFFIRTGIKHEYVEVKDYTKNYYSSQIIPEAEVLYKYQKDNELGLKGAFIIDGYAKNGYQSTLWATAKPWKTKSHRFKIAGIITSKIPDFFYSHFHGNNYQWDNLNLANTLQIQTNIEYSNNFIDAGISNYVINNQIFLDNRYQPLQFEKTIYHLQAFTNIRLRYRSFYWLINATATQGNNDTIMAFPKFSTRQSLFFRFPLFDKRMQFQTGVDVMYITSYYAPRYVPAIGDFVIQHDKQYGNFVYIDYFIGFKVKQFNAMIKIQNAAKGLLGYTYMMIPQYPLPDRLFKLSVSWRFYD